MTRLAVTRSEDHRGRGSGLELAARGKPKKRRVDWGTAGFVAVLLVPGLTLYLLLVLWPMVQSFWVALHRWRGVSGNMTFVGLENFAALPRDERFLQAISHNLAFFAMVATSVLILSLFFANTLSRPTTGPNRLPGGDFFRALFLFPNVVSIVAVSTLWMFVYNPGWGPINMALRALGREEWAVPWLGNGQTALPAVAATYVWYVLGFYILLFRAAIQNIPAEINEAARIDGATGGQLFWRVTIPLLNDVLRLAVIYLIINSMNVFALVWIMAPPDSTGDATQVMLTYLYQEGFVNSNFGKSTALGAANFLIVMTVTLVLQRIWKPSNA
jgi:N-acetylglucosamine transport system permease protein